MLHGNGPASSWRSCGSQQPRESVWSRPLDLLQDARLSSSDRRGFPLQTFSMMLLHSSACYTHGPISTCSLQPGDDRIRCSYLLRLSVYHIWIGFGSPVACTVLLPVAFVSRLFFRCIYMALGALSLPRWNVWWLWLYLDSDFRVATRSIFFLGGNCFTGTCSVVVF